MTSPSELPRTERISRAQQLHNEAETLLSEYRELESLAQAKLLEVQRKYAEAKAMMPLPLFDGIEEGR